MKKTTNTESKAGISLFRLMQRLAETPQEMTAGSAPHLSAIISDLLFDAGGNFLTPAQAEKLDKLYAQPADYRILALIICYLLHDDCFLERGDLSGKMAALFTNNRFKELAGVVKARQFITDPERREELVRLVLDCLSLLPEGETEAKAKDRLTTLDSVERVRLIEKTRKAQERARQLREEMARREAEEAASKMSRE